MTTERSEIVSRLWHILSPYRRKVIGLSVLISFSASLGTVGPQFVRIAFDSVIPSGEVNLFLLLAGAYVGYYLFRAGIGYASMYLSYSFTQSIISDIRMRTYSRLLRLPIPRFTEERSGSLVSRVVSDVNALEGMIQAGATRLAGQLFSILVIATIVLLMSWKLALINVIVAPLLAGVTRHYQGPLRDAARKIRSRVGEMTAVASEAITNIQVVKGFANEPLEAAKFSSENDQYVDLSLSRRKEVGVMEAFVTLTSEYGLGAVLLVGGWMVTRGSISMGELTAFIMYQRMLQRPVISVMFFSNQLQAGLAAMERVSDLLDSNEEVQGDSQCVAGGEIVFDDVTFTYPQGKDAALSGLSLVVPAGETVALVGPSGSGKSTVTRLMSRLYDPDQGAVSLGGNDIRFYTLDALRKAVSVVPQEPTLFSGSVKENIRYAKPDASDEDVYAAAALANAHAFIADLPDGYDTEIGERGVKLSGGQKQRVAIARAILKEARVLILDEATASLDSESEAVIQDALDGLFSRRKGVTSLVVAHRLSTIRNADRIVVLEKGRQIESGTHQDLMALGGLYRTLHDLQYSEETALSRTHTA